MYETDFALSSVFLKCLDRAHVRFGRARQHRDGNARARHVDAAVARDLALLDQILDGRRCQDCDIGTSPFLMRPTRILVVSNVTDRLWPVARSNAGPSASVFLRRRSPQFVYIRIMPARQPFS